MKKTLLWILTAILPASGGAVVDKCRSQRPSAGAQGECVVLLHGLGRTGLSMKGVEWYLTRRGYEVVNLTYPSFRVPMERLANKHLARALAERVPPNTKRVHFVTHSMGGILVRTFLSTHRIENLGRVVMLAPPNQGSEVADRFKRCAFVRRLAGPNLPRLGTAPDDLPGNLGAADFDEGVIAGDRPPFAWLRPCGHPTDGLVSVQSTRLAGMRDFVVVHGSHTFLMCQRETLKHVAEFLQHGHFVHGAK